MKKSVVSLFLVGSFAVNAASTMGSRTNLLSQILNRQTAGKPFSRNTVEKVTLKEMAKCSWKAQKIYRLQQRNKKVHVRFSLLWEAWKSGTLKHAPTYIINLSSYERIVIEIPANLDTAAFPFLKDFFANLPPTIPSTVLITPAEDGGTTSVESITKELHHIPLLTGVLIKSCGLKRLPEGLEHCPFLRYLNLEDNIFSSTGLSSLGALTQLETLEIENCGLSKPPAAIAALSKLHELNLGRNNFKEADFEVLRPIAHQLTSLRLHSCDLSELPSLLDGCTGLKKLYLGDNELTEDADFTLFMPLLNLQALFLNENSLTVMPQALFSLPSLCVLNVADNPLDENLIDTFQLTRPTVGVIRTQEEDEY